MRRFNKKYLAAAGQNNMRSESESGNSGVAQIDESLLIISYT